MPATLSGFRNNWLVYKDHVLHSPGVGAYTVIANVEDHVADVHE